MTPLPGIGDCIFILPKLLLHRGADKVMTYNQKVKFIPEIVRQLSGVNGVLCGNVPWTYPHPPSENWVRMIQLLGKGA